MWSRRAAMVVVAATVLGTVGATATTALVPTTPDASVWGVDGRVRAVVETPDAIYVGGSFTAVVGPAGQTMPRSNLAALDPRTGEPLPFAPPVNNQVHDIAVAPDGTVYAAGQFTRVGGQPRGRGAAFDPVTGGLRAWDPRANALIEAVAVAAGRVYVGGNFTQVVGAGRDRLAALTSSGALVADWSATADGVVHDIAASPDGAQLVIGGAFGAVSGVTAARRLALVDAVSGAVLPLVDRVAVEVFAVTATRDQIFAAGGGAGGHVYAVDRRTRRQQWLVLTDGDAHGVAVQNGVLYAGGHFTRWSGEPASHVVAVVPTTGRRIDWSVQVNSNLGVFTVSAFGGRVSIGGDFTRVNRRPRPHLARFSEAPDTSPPSRPGAPVASSTSSTSARLSWAAAIDDQVRDLVYRVYRDDGTAAVGEVTSAAALVTFDDIGLVPGSTHTWRVQAFDGTADGPVSGPSDPVTLDDPGYPVLIGLAARDEDADGRLDRVVAEFSSDVSCVAPCLAPWTLTAVPSGGALASVAVSGSTAVLTLTEGAGARSTAVGSLRVSLAPGPSGVLDGQGRAGRFGPTAPVDQAGPVPTRLASTPGATDDVMEPGDTFTVTFSEPIDPASVHAANVKELDPVGAGNDQLIIVGLTDGPIDLGSDGYVMPDGGTIVFAGATLTLLSGNTQVRSTIVGSCSGTACGRSGAGAKAPLTFRPEPVLTDVTGNQATGSRAQTIGPY
ncbi:MAG: hypothetical protein ACRC35_12560 [Angustibacter sp.]